MSTYNKAMDYVIIALTASMRGNNRLAKRAFGKALSNKRALAEAVEDMNEMQEDKVGDVEDIDMDDDDDDDDDMDDDVEVESYFRNRRSSRASNSARRRIFSMEDDDMGDDDLGDNDIDDLDDDDDDDDDMGEVESRFMRRKRHAVRAHARRKNKGRRRSSLVSVESRLIRGDDSRRRRRSSSNSRLGRVSRNLASI